MLPIEYDAKVLNDLPLPDEARVQKVLAILHAMVARRVLPYFRGRGGVDEVALARVSERYSIERLEDPHGRIRNVSVLTHSRGHWTIHIHERIFDYIAFGIPWEPKADVDEAAPEGRKALAFAELLLRHELEHMIRADRGEREVIISDAEFAMDRREGDARYYGMLREALGDELGGLKGERYLELIDRFERGAGVEEVVANILKDHARAVAEIPTDLLRGAFRVMGRDFRSQVIDACYRNSRNTSFSLVQRSHSLGKVFALFHEQLEADPVELESMFNVFTDRWGLAVLFHELDVPERRLEQHKPHELFTVFVSRLREIRAEERAAMGKEGGRPAEPIGRLEPQEALSDPPRKSLKNRIEDARKNRLVPRAVLEIIEKNRTNLEGHSAAKYTELVETLLAVPWGKLHPIDVGPKEFAAGLNASHYGLHRPKETISDFFSNLIWRYRNFSEEKIEDWKRSGSAFLFVGPPGVGKTSLAISIARNLGIPYHKVSLGGMRDESDLRGHGFTYEGSKPGAIVQGLIKMGVMNGMFILDEADKTEKFAIATLLEILDPEQNHLFHDKYAQTTVDIDLSNCHFILTANTLETVPAPVVDRCQVVVLDRYSVEEKVAIARRHIIPRIREQFRIDPDVLSFVPEQEEGLLRDLVKTYTHEAGVRQLEWTLRTLFLRLQRRELFDKGRERVTITHRHIKHSLEEPTLPRRINEEDRIGDVLALGVDVERGVGSVIPIQATRIRGGLSDGGGSVSMIHPTGNIEKVMDESRKVATTAILHCAEELGIDPDKVAEPVHLHFMGGSSRKDGPSAGGAIGVVLASLLAGRKLRRDVAITGEIDTQGRLTAVGGLDVKLETAASAGCKTVIIPEENLRGAGGIERFPEALKRELQVLSYDDWQQPHSRFDYRRHVLQVVAVEHITQAHRVASIDDREVAGVESLFASHARQSAKRLVEQGTETSHCPMTVVVKEAEELEQDYCKTAICRKCPGCRLLVPKSDREAFEKRWADMYPRVRISEFDLSTASIGSAINEAIRSAPSEPRSSATAVVAPYYALKQALLASRPGSPLGSKRGVKLFANNYAVQGVKLKRCKTLLNRTYCRLLHCGVEVLAKVPFLVLQDDIYMVDLSIIPEKYRLLVSRAEEILNASLHAWLETVDDALEDGRPSADSVSVLSG